MTLSNSQSLISYCQKLQGREAQVTNSTEDSLGQRYMELKYIGANLALNKLRDKTCIQEDGKIGGNKNNNLSFQ